MATIKIEIELYTDAGDDTGDALENALEGGLADDIAGSAAREFRNQAAYYLGVPSGRIHYDYTVLDMDKESVHDTTL